MVRISAVRAISKLKITKAGSNLMSLLNNDAQPEVRVEALKALAALQDEHIGQAISRAIADKEKPVRIAGLGLMQKMNIDKDLMVTLLSDVIKRVLYQSPRVFAIAFIAGGLVMLAVERFRAAPTLANAELIPLPRAFGVGLCQALALIPGVSRSGATIVGGMVLGLDRAAAAEFSFFLAIPTMTAAFAHDLLDVRHNLSAARALEIGVGLSMAFVSSLLIIRPFLSFVRRSGFAPFAWYRIALGTVLLVAIAAGWLRG